MTLQQLIKINRTISVFHNSFLKTIYPFIIFLIFIASSTYAQFNIEIVGNKHFSLDEYISWINLTPSVKAQDLSPDSIKKSILSSLSSKGYYNPTIENIEIDSAFIRISLDEGNPTTINNITVKESLSDSLYISNELNYLKSEIFNSQLIEATFEKILDYLENNGYPFSIIKLESVLFNTDSSTGNNFVDIILSINEGTQASIDKILVEGNNKTNDNVITRSARINIGELFSQKVLDDIPNRLNRLRFFELVEAPIFYLATNNNGILKILIKEKETNSFDGIAGYVPSISENETGYLTGFINISLRNLFCTGRSTLIKWMRENKSSQELQLRYVEPWLFGFPFNIEVGLFQRKQDSTFVQRNIEFNFEYLANEDLTASVLINSQSTIPTERASGVFTVFNSSSLTTGFNLKVDTRDDFYSPTKGFYFSTGYKFTNKKIIGSQALISSNIQTNYNHQRLEFDFSYFQKLFERQIFYFSIHGRELKGSNLDLSDLYFLGGTNTLRGYREKQFHGNRLLWSNLEYRLLISQRTYAFAFYDYGYILRNEDPGQISLRSHSYKSGYGFGLNIETGLGVLGISFALGNGDSFSDGKIHFGVINEF